MTWTVKHDPSMGIVEVAYNGSTTGNDLRAATSQAVSVGREKGSANFLVDASGLELTASILDIYELPAKQYVEEGVARHSRIAVIRPRSPNAQEAATFYETVCNNRGWLVRVFAERREAVDWLAHNIVPIKSSSRDD